MNIGLFILWMDYWINKRNHFSVNEFIQEFVGDGNASPGLTVKYSKALYNMDKKINIYIYNKWEEIIIVIRILNYKLKAFLKR